ncbi:hypothetical protein [Actinoplanes missouriensis]|nr:hypothetical protein [Actinoplanes missouriensis]
MTTTTDLFDLEMAASRARQRVESAALDSISASHYYRDEERHADAAAEYAGEQLALAARDLVRAIEALPPQRQPIGWDATVVPS